MMVAIAWNSPGFHLLDALPKGNTIDAECDRVNILTDLLPLRLHVDGRRLGIHAASAPRPKMPRFCEEHRLCIAVHPPYSPDLPPFDFFLFGHVKLCLQGIAFPSREESFASTHEIVAVIPRSILEDMLRHWMEKLKWVSQNNGDYYP
jgi:hypothetical protein